MVFDELLRESRQKPNLRRPPSRILRALLGSCAGFQKSFLCVFASRPHRYAKRCGLGLCVRFSLGLTYAEVFRFPLLDFSRLSGARPRCDPSATARRKEFGDRRRETTCLVALAAASPRDECRGLRLTARRWRDRPHTLSAPRFSAAVLHIPLHLHPFCSLGRRSLLFQGETLSPLEKRLSAGRRPAGKVIDRSSGVQEFRMAPHKNSKEKWLLWAACKNGPALS